MRPRLLDIDRALAVPAAAALAGLFVLLLVTTLSEPPAPEVSDAGECPVGAEEDLLSPYTLRCWFDIQRGRWRITRRLSAHTALVVEAEASELRYAEEIARRFVADTRHRFSEIVVYVRRETSRPPHTIRRVRWTRRGGYETLEFSS